MSDRSHQLPQSHHAGDVREFRLRFLQGLFGALMLAYFTAQFIVGSSRLLHQPGDDQRGC